MGFNYADAAVVIILAICVMNAKRKGITYFAVSIIGKIISLFLSVTLYGSVSRMLRETPLFPYMKERVGSVIDAETAPYIDGFSQYLIANDNNEIYKLFRVETFSDYVTSYVTNIAFNILSLIIVYICVSAIISILFNANRIFSKLPLVSQLNTVTGILAGLAEGVIIIWIAVVILLFFVIQGRFTNIYEILLSSKLAIYFLEYNIFALAIFKVAA